MELYGDVKVQKELSKEEYWKNYGSQYDAELRHRWGLNPFNPKHIMLIGKLHVRHKKQINRRLNAEDN